MSLPAWSSSPAAGFAPRSVSSDVVVWEHADGRVLYEFPDGYRAPDVGADGSTSVSTLAPLVTVRTARWPAFLAGAVAAGGVELVAWLVRIL